MDSQCEENSSVFNCFLKTAIDLAVRNSRRVSFQRRGAAIEKAFRPSLLETRGSAGLISKCTYHMRQIRRIRSNITEDACRKAIQGLVTSRMDYCNTLLAGSSKTEVKRLQMLQNRARLITMTPRRASITPILYNLHWIPVEKRIEYKILVYAQL